MSLEGRRKDAKGGKERNDDDTDRNEPLDPHLELARASLGRRGREEGDEKKSWGQLVERRRKGRRVVVVVVGGVELINKRARFSVRYAPSFIYCQLSGT